MTSTLHDITVHCTMSCDVKNIIKCNKKAHTVMLSASSKSNVPLVSEDKKQVEAHMVMLSAHSKSVKTPVRNIFFFSFLVISSKPMEC